MRVFISYSRKDINAAKQIAEILTARGAEVFIDYQSIVGGESFLARIGREIRECDHFLLLLSANSAASTYVNDEVQNARVRGKPILVLRLDDTPMPDAFFFLESRQHITAYELMSGENLRDAAVVRLCRALDLPFNSSGVSPADPVLNFLPTPFAWCPIPAGKVEIWDEYYDVPDFEMAKYPITNAQFQVFVDAHDGYSDPKWWNFSEEAIVWRKENSQPQPPAFEGDDHPRANISWFESVAFCHWLTARLYIESKQPVISLPTEAQWQWAALSDSIWDYPWGRKFDPSRCNSSVGKKSQGTLKVTTYEGTGDSPFGVVDMIGNIWEWCQNPWREIASTDLRGIGRRAMRGGSWTTGGIGNLSALYRISWEPKGWNSGLGFRIIRNQSVDT